MGEPCVETTSTLLLAALLFSDGFNFLSFVGEAVLSIFWLMRAVSFVMSVGLVGACSVNDVNHRCSVENISIEEKIESPRASVQLTHGLDSIEGDFVGVDIFVKQTWGA